MFLAFIYCKFLCGGPLENQPIGLRASLLKKLKYENMTYENGLESS